MNGPPLLDAHEVATCETDPTGCDVGPEPTTTDPWGPAADVCRTHDTPEEQ